jgi:hypothetical protein
MPNVHLASSGHVQQRSLRLEWRDSTTVSIVERKPKLAMPKRRGFYRISVLRWVRVFFK